MNRAWKKIKNSSFITIILVAVSVAVYVYMNVLDRTGFNQNRVIFYGALYRQFVLDNDQWYRLISASFIHFDLEHLLFNMIALYFVGTELEKVLGHFRYFLVYFASVLGGSILTLALGGSDIISAGASTGIFGLFASYVAMSKLYPESRFLAARARNFAVLIMINLVLNLFATDVDMWGHIGGALGGVLSTGFVGLASISFSAKKQIPWFLVYAAYVMICLVIALREVF